MIDQYLEIGYQIVIALSFICTGATIIAKYTETKKDDEFLAKVDKWLKAAANLKKPQK
jgi:hypothetical protein|tara:strand:+ start:397 stop:570 length:174 start_codon:yes stop_codon:yes gene_type:complete